MYNNQSPYIISQTNTQPQCADSSKAFTEAFVKAVELMNKITADAERKCVPAYTALRSGKADVMLTMIQEYVILYGADWQRLQGVHFQPVASSSPSILAQQLQSIIGLVHWDTALKAIRDELLHEFQKNALEHLLTPPLATPGYY